MNNITNFKKADHGICPRCKNSAISYRTWRHPDGLWEDYEYKCNACNHYWKVEGEYIYADIRDV